METAFCQIPGSWLGVFSAAPAASAVTASLRLDYLAPTPIGEPMELRARVREARGRKRVVECVVRSGGRETVRAEVIAVDVPGSWGEG